MIIIWKLIKKNCLKILATFSNIKNTKIIAGEKNAFGKTFEK